MTTLDEKHNSICSTSITDERILDYLVRGHNVNADDYNETTLPIHNTGYCTNPEGCNTNRATKNDTGYYSGSSENVTHENGSHILDGVALCNTPASNSVQEEYHTDYVKEDTLTESPPLQTVRSPIPSDYAAESQYQSHTIEIKNKSQGDYFSDSTTSNQHTVSPVNILMKETKENSKPFVVFEEDSFPYMTEEIQPISLTTYPVSVGKYESKNLPVVSEGEYFPYTAAINQFDSSTVTKLTVNSHDESQSCSTEINSVASMKLTKQGISIADSFSHVTLNEEDTCHTVPLSDSHHSCTSTDKKNSTNINGYIYDISYITDVTSHLESNSDLDVCNSTTMHS